MNIRKFFTKEQKPEPVAEPEKPIYAGEVLVYTDKTGAKYYACPPDKLHNVRKNLLNIQLQQVDFGISGAEFIAGLENLERDLTKLGSGAKDYHEFRLKMTRFLANTIERTGRILNGSLELTACALIFRHEDEPWEYSGMWAQRKFKMWEQDEDAKYFFLALFLREFRNLSKASPESVKEYLQTQELSDLARTKKRKN